MTLAYYVTEVSSERWPSLFWSQQESIRADIAQLVEHFLGKEKVPSSILGVSSEILLDVDFGEVSSFVMSQGGSTPTSSSAGRVDIVSRCGLIPRH